MSAARHLLGLWVGVIALACLVGCAGPSEDVAAVWEMAVSVPSEPIPEEGNVYSIYEGEIVHLQAGLEPAESVLSLDLDNTKVVWVSDVGGVISSDWQECGASDSETDTGDESVGDPAELHDCWLTDFDVTSTGEVVWPMVATLPLGTHLVRAKAIDLNSGMILTESGATVITVQPRVPPDVHLVSPAGSFQISPGESFELEAWISSGSGGDVEVTLATSSGQLIESTANADGLWTVTCHAGVQPGEGEGESACVLPPGGQVLVLTATDDQGVSTHAFASIVVEQDHE